MAHVVKRASVLASAAVMLALGGVGVALIVHRDARGDAPAPTHAEPALTVATTIARASAWQPTLEAIGNLRAVRGADLAAETSGIVQKILFTSGADVRAGTDLLELRLNDEPSRLEGAKAAASLAAINLARDQREFAANAVSRAVVDQDQATLEGDRAQVAAEQALIDEKIVRAPFDGRLGVRLVDPGQYLPAGTPVVTLQALDPILMDFYVPESSLAALVPGAAATVGVDSWPGRRFPARVIAITPRVDQASRTVLVRAELPNRDGALLPGMFATIHVDAGRALAVAHVTVPQAAIAFSTYGDTVWVLRRDGDGALRAHPTLVRTGETRGDRIAVLSGLRAGDEVVTAGQLKLHDGAAVAVDNAVRPSGALDPTPANE